MYTVTFKRGKLYFDLRSFENKVIILRESDNFREFIELPVASVKMKNIEHLVNLDPL